MKEKTDIERLATLSHIYISKEEQKMLEVDIDSILSYVEQIQDISAKTNPEIANHHNIMRDDGEPHESGIYSKDLMNEAPSVKDGYIEVKKVIDQSNQAEK